MGVILGTMTQVIIGGVSDGFQSINWNIGQQPNRLWQLGSWQPWNTQLSATVSLSVTAYAGALPTENLQAATSCEKSTAVRTVILNAAACGPGSVNETFEDMFITSYSYSKGDPVGYGTESWSFQAWIETDVSGYINTPAPSTVLQGISEGSLSGDDFERGLEFYPNTGITGRQGSVSAGVPGIGNAESVTLGVVSRIGGGELEALGLTGQSNASIPHQPLYIQI
jgi:hypothetical protein